MKVLNLDFSGKTIKNVNSNPNKDGLVSDIEIEFTDGTVAYIGASKDGFLVSVIYAKPGIYIGKNGKAIVRN